MGLARKIAPCLWFDDQGESAAGKRAMAAVLKLKKLDIAELQKAYEG
jgi:predicted 3-demethylubiquinone-9 3-methyltransferase (glyoxalase superfamily)